MERSVLVIVALALLAYVQAQTSYKLSALPNAQTLLGEGPHWDIATKSLYFVDIDNTKLLRYDFTSNTTYGAKLLGETFATFIIPIKGRKNKFVVGCERRIAVVAWDGVSPTAKVERNAYEVEQGAEYARNGFNDGKADSKGRLLTGTMFNDPNDYYGTRTGTLYSFAAGKPIKKLISNVGVSNGLTWNDNTKKFYFVDSANHNVTEYNYDIITGNISNPRVVWQHPTHMPDGMTIDADGNLYICTFTGYRIYKVNPRTKEILLEIVFPTKRVTSAAFGGPNLDILYVTTAVRGELAPAGTTYQVTGLGVKGLPMAKVRL